jgi:glyoxylate/hydroxypyruvate reductase A
LDALHAACPHVTWSTEFSPGQTFDAAVVANPPPGTLTGLKGLRLIQSLWAGVDRVLQDETLPADVPLARMVDPAMTAAMAETALWAVLSLHRGFFDYTAQQRQTQWHQHPQRRAEEVSVLVLGHGVMGQAVSSRLAAQGYSVTAWRRGEPPGLALQEAHAASSPGAVCTLSGGAGLTAALPRAQILINLLPLTMQTLGILGAATLSRLPRGASVVNFGRGGHLVEADLAQALDAGHLKHAVLDVFAQEPLPADHPFWRHPKITVLPHVAALTDLVSAAAVVADNLDRLARGLPLRHLVDRHQGY